MSELITEQQFAHMADNFRLNAARHCAGEPKIAFLPVVKLCNPSRRVTWLLSEYDADFGILFGLFDKGIGVPELANVALADIRNLDEGAVMAVDTLFRPSKTLEEYAADAYREGSIKV